jgi:two-component system sensor histidine kinase RpfC
MSVLTRARALVRAPLNLLAQPLGPDADHELEMSVNRLVFAGLGVAFLLVADHAKDTAALAAMGLYFILTFGIFADILRRPRICQVRRVFALLLDCVILSWQLHLGGERVALFYPVYLWVIFGNGFRFGVRALLIAVPVAALSFLAVILSTPFWRGLPYLSAGLLIGLVVLPAYAGALIRKLSQAMAAAEEANKAKSLFLASVSHELRTPLTAIIGMSELLSTSALNGAQSEMVETIGVASRSLQTLINQLLDFSRVEAGRMILSVEEFDLLTLLVDVRRIVDSQAREKDLAIKIHLTPRTPMRLKTSRLQLQEILINLVGNAVKFTEAGSVTIALDAEPVPGSEDKVTLRGEISDTGIGIPLEAQERIFESFTQGDASILNRCGGTGRGLAITKRLVGLLGGGITVKSVVGRGSTFRFDIRAERAGAAEQVWEAPAGKVGLRVRNPLKRSVMRAPLAGMGVEAELVNPGDPVPSELRVLVDYSAEGELPESAEPVAASLPAVISVHPSASPGLPSLAVRQRCITLLSDDFSDQELRRAMVFADRPAGAAMPAAHRAGEPGVADTAAPEVLPVALVRREVLLVDDNRINQRVFTRILESAGHRVTVADDGNAAIDILALEDERFDIVLMDFNMPGMDGLEATKLYRLMSLGKPRLPVIGLTADIFAQEKRDWRAADMDGCLVNPVAPQDLVASVEKMARIREPSVVITSLEEWTEQSGSGRVGSLDDELDDAIIANLRLLGDNAFVNELLMDFLSDAKDLIGQLAADAARGDVQEFHNHAHALRSSAANVGAKALGNLCKPWGGLRGSELKAQAAIFTARADAELSRTTEAVLALNKVRRANSH